MNRAERLGMGGSGVAHVALVAILSLGLFAAPKPPVPITQPVDVQLIDEVAAVDTAPVVALEAPAPSVAPEIGEPDPVVAPLPPPTPPPPPAVARSTPIAKPVATPRAAPARTTPPAKAKPAPAAPKGGRLGPDFLKGLTANSEPGQTSAPRAAVGPAQLAGLASAIRRQVQPCADRVVSPGPGAEAIITKLNLRLNRDGSFAVAPRVISQSSGAENARYAPRVGELARAAFQQCAPFELPAELYDGWKNINLNYRLPG